MSMIEKEEILNHFRKICVTEKDIKRYDMFIAKFFPFSLKGKVKLMDFFKENSFNNEDLKSFKLKEVGQRYIKFYVNNRIYRFNFDKKNAFRKQTLSKERYEMLMDFKVEDIPLLFASNEHYISEVIRIFYSEAKRITDNFTKWTYGNKDIKLKDMETSYIENTIVFIFKRANEGIVNAAKYTPLIYFLIKELDSRK